eukprot:TRINITY_DN1512_c1_g1_i1.p1 TRINITY_DN1512_c1_g1~~TRINITY_DN1512_c1_g1_i1.p1  ORF type:complete len:260 (-),score=32.64 TRINITY_DN1512_c1_g1_i1:365-1144(-)
MMPLVIGCLLTTLLAVSGQSLFTFPGSGFSEGVAPDSVLNSFSTINQLTVKNEALTGGGNASSGNLIQEAKIIDTVGTQLEEFGLGISQIAFNNEVSSKSEKANSGSETNIQNITSSTLVGFQDAFQNQASSGSDGDANSGNRFSIGNIANTTLSGFQFAEKNIANSTQGDANAGNVEALGDTSKSDIDLQQTAQYNEATSEDGDANSGNFGIFSDINGGNFDISQIAFGNQASSDNGQANAGNAISFDSFFVRKLLIA